MIKLLFALLILNSAFAKDSLVEVQGNCNIKVTPDRGSVSFTADNQAKDQTTAVKATNDQINALKKEIESMKLAQVEFKNTGYNVFPVREYERNKYVDKGTKATLTLEVSTSDIEKLGNTLVSASKIGIQNVGALNTFLSLEKSQKEYLRCLDIAAQDAKEKAQQLAKKLGFKIGDVVKVVESPQITSSPRTERVMMMKGAMASADMAPTQIEAGTEQFSTTLQVSFAIK